MVLLALQTAGSASTDIDHVIREAGRRARRDWTAASLPRRRYAAPPVVVLEIDVRDRLQPKANASSSGAAFSSFRQLRMIGTHGRKCMCL